MKVDKDPEFSKLGGREEREGRGRRKRKKRKKQREKEEERVRMKYLILYQIMHWLLCPFSLAVHTLFLSNISGLLAYKAAPSPVLIRERPITCLSLESGSGSQNQDLKEMAFLQSCLPESLGSDQTANK